MNQFSFLHYTEAQNIASPLDNFHIFNISIFTQKLKVFFSYRFKAHNGKENCGMEKKSMP